MDETAGVSVKGYKLKNYKVSIFATLQPLFHATCSLAKLSLQP